MTPSRREKKGKWGDRRDAPARVRNDFRRGPPPRCRRGDYSGDEPSTRHSTARRRAQLVETPVKVAIEGSCISPIRATNETALVALIGELHVFIHQISRCVFPGSSPVPRLSKPSEWGIPRGRRPSCGAGAMRGVSPPCSGSYAPLTPYALTAPVREDTGGTMLNAGVLLTPSIAPSARSGSYGSRARPSSPAARSRTKARCGRHKGNPPAPDGRTES